MFNTSENSDISKACKLVRTKPFVALASTGNSPSPLSAFKVDISGNCTDARSAGGSGDYFIGEAEAEGLAHERVGWPINGPLAGFLAVSPNSRHRVV